MISSLSRGLSLGLGRRAAKEQASKLGEPVEAAIECETFHKLESYMASDAFLAKLTQPAAASDEGESEPSASMSEQISEAMSGHIADSPACLGPAGSSSSASTTAATAEGFVVVDKQCAIESMAYFIAETLMNCPQAASLPPAKLQEAVVLAIQSLKQSKFKKLCTVGHYAYRWTALGYSAFQMYSNPWIMQAIIRAIFALSRMTLRTWV